jgi:hypothetical protein
VANRGTLRVYVDGGPKLRAALKDAGHGLEDLKAAQEQAARFIAHAAAAVAPRRTGRLAASIRGNRAVGAAVVAAGNRSTLPYANPVHWGWPKRNIKPNRFVWDTAIATEPVWRPIYEAEVRRIIDKVGGVY